MQKNKTILLSIITVNYNGLSDTLELIKTLYFHLNDINYEIIVIDNGSNTDESSEIKNKYPEVISLRSEKNLGFAGGNNIGLAKASGEYLLLINNDTLVADDSIKYLIETMEENPKVGIISPKIIFESNKHIQFAGYTEFSKLTMRNKLIGNNEIDRSQYDKPSDSAYAHGAAMLIRKEVLENAGYIPEIYFLYYEELDWSLRIKEAGYQIYYEPKTRIYHKESQSTGKGSPFKEYYIARNKLIFTYRNRSRINSFLSISYILGISFLIKTIKNIFKGEFLHIKARIRAVKDFYKMKNAGEIQNLVENKSNNKSKDA